jgi:drug/metabolite transporter (DMT)-like permease
MKTNHGVKWAVLSAIVYSVIVGFSFLFMKSALEFADPFVALAYRFIISFIVMSVPVGLGLIKLQFRGKSFRGLLWLALLYPTLFFALQAFGLKYATSAEGGILYAFTPILTVMCASYFLKERTNRLQKLSIAISVFGVLLMVLVKGVGLDPSHLVGILLLFLSVLSFAGYGVLARKLTQQFSPAELTYFMMGVGSIVFGLIALVQHGMNGTMSALVTPLTYGSFWTSILYLSVLSSLLSFLLITFTLSKMEASKVSVFSNLSTVVSMIAGAVLLGESVTLYDWIGSALIIAGVIGMNIRGNRAVSAPASASAAKQQKSAAPQQIKG